MLLEGFCEVLALSPTCCNTEPLPAPGTALTALRQRGRGGTDHKETTARIIFLFPWAVLRDPLSIPRDPSSYLHPSGAQTQIGTANGKFGRNFISFFFGGGRKGGRGSVPLHMVSPPPAIQKPSPQCPALIFGDAPCRRMVPRSFRPPPPAALGAPRGANSVLLPHAEVI